MRIIPLDRFVALFATVPFATGSDEGHGEKDTLIAKRKNCEAR
jgi:hypothetical protein